MKGKWIKKICGISLFMMVFIIPFLPGFQSYIALSEASVGLANHTQSSPVMGNDETDTILVKNDQEIPIKKIQLAKQARPKVIPGGESIGIEVETEGVTIVGFHQPNKVENAVSPAYEAGIRMGDIMTKLNDQSIQSVDDVQAIIQNHEGTSITTEIRRGEEKKQLTIHLLEEKKHQLGIYIKDRATGIGTLSFHLPETNEYGALGHIISDNDTKKPIHLKKGNLVRSSVKSIEKGNKGSPGEKQASFITANDPLGTITKNSPYGIYGVLNKKGLEFMKNKEAIPIAYDDEIEKGPAKIYTVIEKEKVETFDVEIMQVKGQSHRATKGIILRVTDEKLLQATGGIVQGMSGSPIIQNGKMIGAVTHVFVNDPTTGYGVQIEWMLEELNKDNLKDKQLQAS